MAESTAVTLSSSTNQFKLVTDESDVNRPRLKVVMTDSQGNELGGYIETWFQDGRLTSRLPGVDGSYFHIQPEDDHIEVNE